MISKPPLAVVAAVLAAFWFPVAATPLSTLTFAASALFAEVSLAAVTAGVFPAFFGSRLISAMISCLIMLVSISGAVAAAAASLFVSTLESGAAKLGGALTAAAATPLFFTFL